MCFSCLSSFVQHSAYEIRRLYLDFAHSYSCILFKSMNIPHFLFIHFTADGNLPIFLFLVIVKSVAMNILIHAFNECTYTFLGVIYLGLKLLDQKV